MPRRVLVTGGREYSDYEKVCVALREHLQPDDVLVHGAASGADTLAERCAKSMGITTEAHPADWKKHGRAAGPIRNSEMLASGVELLLAFPGGAGTRDMTNKVRAKGVQIIEIK